MPSLYEMMPSSSSTASATPRQKKYTLTDLRNDEEFQQTAERFLTSMGEKGTVEDMFEYFRGTDWNLYDSGKLALQSGKFTNEQKQDYSYLRSKFDNAEVGGLWEKAKAGADIGWEIVSDPATLASLFFIPWSGGTSVASRVAAGKVAQGVLKKLANKEIAEGVAKGVARLPGQTLKAPLSKKAVTAVLATEGAAFGSGHDYASQVTDVNTDRLEEVNLKQTLTSGAIGAAAGPVLGGAGLGISKFNKAIKSSRLRRIEGGEDYKEGLFDTGVSKTDSVMEALRPTGRRLTAFVTKPTSRFVRKMKEDERLERLIKKFRYDTGRKITGEASDVAEEASERSFYEIVNDYVGRRNEELVDILEPLKRYGAITVPRTGSRDAFFKLPFGITKRSRTPLTKKKSGLFGKGYNRISDETNDALVYYMRTGKDEVIKDGKPLSLDEAFKLTEHTGEEIVEVGVKLRKWLDEFHNDAKAAKLDIDYIENYLPRQYNYEMVKQEIKNFEKHGVEGKLIKEMKRAYPDLENNPTEILNILQKINDPSSRVGKSYTELVTLGKKGYKKDSKGQLVLDEQGNPIPLEEGKPVSPLFPEAKPALTKERKLSDLNDNNISEYLDDNIENLLANQYAPQAGAFIQRKIHLGEDLIEFGNKILGPIQKTLIAKGKPLTSKELKSLENIYLTTTGQMPSFKDGVLLTASQKRAAADVATVMNQVALLPLSTVTSWAEIAVPLVRGAGGLLFQQAKAEGAGIGEGGIRTLFKTSRDYGKMWWNDVVKKDLVDARPEALKELNRFNRALNRAGEDRALAMYGQGYGRRASIVQNKFFKINMLHDWTRFTQLVSFNVGKSKMYENLYELWENKAKKHLSAKKQLRLENELSELGIKNIDEGIGWVEDGGRAYGDFYDDSFLPSAARYVDEVIMNPTAASNQKPLWYSMPSTRWLFGLLGFPTAFSNTVLKGAVREVAKDVRSGQPLHSTPSIVLGLTTMSAISMFGNTVRTGGKNLEEVELGEKTIGDEVFDSLKRSGLLGPAESIIRTQEARAYDRHDMSLLKHFTGPVVNDVLDLVQRYESPASLIVSKIPGLSLLRTANPDAYKDIMDAARAIDPFKRRPRKKEEEKEVYPVLYAKGGRVENVPQVPREPDERIDKMTGLPYNVQAGKAFIDEEDPEKREKLVIGGKIISRAMRNFLISPKKLDEIIATRETKMPDIDVPKTRATEEATEEIAEEATEAATSAAGKDVARLQAVEETDVGNLSREEVLASINKIPLKERLEIIRDDYDTFYDKKYEFLDSDKIDFYEDIVDLKTLPSDFKSNDDVNTLLRVYLTRYDIPEKFMGEVDTFGEFRGVTHFKELDNNKIRIFVPANQYGGQNKFTTKTFDNPSKKEIEDFLTSSSVDKSIREDVARLQAKELAEGGKVRKGFQEGGEGIQGHVLSALRNLSEGYTTEDVVFNALARKSNIPGVRNITSKKGTFHYDRPGLLGKDSEVALRFNPEEKSGGVQFLKRFNEGGEAEDPLIEIVKNSLREKEGLEYEAYKPVPEEEHFTIGYGHYGPDVKEGQVIDEAQAEEYLDTDVRIRVEEARKLIKPFNQFPLEVQGAIMDEFYRGSIRQSPNTVELINKGRYAEAANEYLDNDEYREAEELGKPGIRSRMERVSEALRSLED